MLPAMQRLWPLLVALAACGANDTSEPNEPSPTAVATTTSTPSAPAPTPTPTTPAESGPRAEDESFVLEARPQADGYPADALGAFAIVIEGQGGWHLNHDFPVSVELTGDGVQFPKPLLGKEDAAEFVDERARFDVPFTPSAGEREVRATVSFAMCNPTSCVPKTQTLTLALDVR
jgi:hypothetical protein